MTRTEITAIITEESVEVRGRTGEHYLSPDLVNRLKEMFDRSRIIDYFRIDHDGLLEAVFYIGCNCPDNQDFWMSVQVGGEWLEEEEIGHIEWDLGIHPRNLDVGPIEEEFVSEAAIFDKRDGRVAFKVVF